ncbi:EamA family transporter [Psychromicrobium xiongbiense]|uniref:EamA family transporter n=1 Tax=Psychromicrobium xiongbiense TaxID=3051184 RepID=UPI002552D36A|nr:DMT family transporter [Psychromicrobium sp. YIM S02556]
MTRLSVTPLSGLGLSLASAAAFAFSGSFAKSLFEAGWSTGAAALARLGGAALVLLVPTLILLMKHWPTVRSSLPRIALYGVVPMALCQLFFFNAVQHLSVGVALLLEYLSPVLLVLYAWARTKRHPALLTMAGGLSAVAGLVLVLDVTGSQSVDLVGVLWGLAAAVCSAVYFAMAAKADDVVPPVLMTGGGLLVGSVLIGVLGLTGLMPMGVGGSEVVFFGQSTAWWVPLLGMILVTTVFAYLTGILSAQRLGSRLASFVALVEVLFAVVWAWLLLGEVPRQVQLVGGALIVLGVVLVRWGEIRQSREVVPATVSVVAPVEIPEPGKAAATRALVAGR